MISRLNNDNSSFQSADGINSEQESIKSAPSDSKKTGLITEIGMPAADATNSPQQDLYRDQWTTEDPHKASKGFSMIDVVVSQAKPNEYSDNASNIKIPSRMEYPNLKAEKKEP